MAKYEYDREFAEAAKGNDNLRIPESDDVFECRQCTNNWMQRLLKDVPTPPGVTETEFAVQTDDGATLKVIRYVPPQVATGGGPQPCIIGVRGGGFIAISPEMYGPVYNLVALATGRTVFGAPYRLAPEHPFPTPLNDVVAVIKYVSAHASDLEIDPARIGVFGQSAGGNLSLGAALKLRDEGFEPPIAKLILQYPPLDDRTNLPEGHPKGRVLLWTQRHNNVAWKAYLGKDRRERGDDISLYAAPSRATDLSGLPSTYLETGDLDLFAEEIVVMAARLVAAGVPTELHVSSGMPHVWEAYAAATTKGKEATGYRFRAMQDF